MKLWDSAGQLGFESMQDVAFYKGADVLILVFDVTQAKTFESLDGWHKQFIEHAKPKSPETLPVVVLGNKTDDGERQVSREDALRWCAAKGDCFLYFEVSAKEGGILKDVSEIVALKGVSSNG